MKNPSKSICCGSFHQNKSYPHLVQTLTIRTPFTMCIEAKSARCWKFSPTDTRIDFPPGSIFQPNRTVMTTGLSFLNTLCTRSECNLPILMENNKKHQITLPKGQFGLSSLHVVDRGEPKYQTRSSYELTNAISLLMNGTVAAFTRTNPILIYDKFGLLEPLIRCILMLKVPVAGKIRLQTLVYTSHQALLFNRIELLWLLACFS